MKMKPAKRGGAKRGRPRSFDPDKALDRALRVFWKKGYEGASLPELTKAMGINRPSLYAAFGNKEALFKKVMDRYVAGPAGYVCEALAEPTARRVVERLFCGALDMQTDPRNPRGCLMVQGALACGDDAERVRREMAARRSAGDEALRRRFERAVAEGDLPAGTDVAGLTQYVVTILRGMSVQAASGAGRDDLQRVVDLAMRAWPGK